MTSDETINLINRYPEFYGNPAIRTLAELSRWTASDNTKRPINMRALLHTLTTGEQITNSLVEGAHEISIETLVPLADIVHTLPNVHNHAFFLDAHSTGYIVLDIEPDCPAPLRERLLQIPAIYSETSLSGNGYHLLLPLPANWNEFPLAQTKVKLQEEHRWYEFLIYHWVTFTRKPIPLDRYSTTLPPAPPGLYEGYFAQLAALAKPNLLETFDVDAERPVFEHYDNIVDTLARLDYRKDTQTFHNDISRWEFGYMRTLLRALEKMLSDLVARGMAPEEGYSDSDYAWLLYDAATKALPGRAKHLEFRDGQPLLLHTATKLVADMVAENEAKRQKNEETVAETIAIINQMKNDTP